MTAKERLRGGLVPELKRLVLENRDEVLTEARLAERVSYSVTHIRRAFRAAMKEPLGVFMRRIRVEMAAGLLSTSDEPIEKIASASHYASREALSKAFSSWIGCPPAAFRALNQGESHLLPSYLYSTGREPSPGHMEVGIYVSEGRLVTSIYEGFSLVGRIDLPQNDTTSERLRSLPRDY